MSADPTAADNAPARLSDERIEEMLQMRAVYTHAEIEPFLPGKGGNDGIVRDTGGHVVADCNGHEGHAELIAAMLNTLPNLLTELRERRRREANIRALFAEVPEWRDFWNALTEPTP